MSTDEMDQIADELVQRLRLSDEDAAIKHDITADLVSCMAELERVGVKTDTRKPLIQKAAELYVKWQWDYLGKGDRFEKSFCALRDAMSLTQSYLSGEGE